MTALCACKTDGDRAVTTRSGEPVESAVDAARFVRERPRAPQLPSELGEPTARASEILAPVARGLSNSEIVVSGTTVATHVARVLAKLGLRDRVQAVVLAYEAGVVSPGLD